ncbi:MAG: FHA domain-containing protein, partial [bacterium]|nr:FHA domain-containing protein [bacterium]
CYPQQEGYPQQQESYPNESSEMNPQGYQHHYFDDEGNFASDDYPQPEEQQPDMNSQGAEQDFSEDIRAAQEPPQPFGQQSPQPRAPYSPFVRRPEGRSNKARQHSQNYPLITDQGDPKLEQVVVPPQSSQPQPSLLPNGIDKNQGVIITNSPDEFPEIELGTSRGEEGQSELYKADYVFSCIQGSRQGEKVAILASCMTEERTLTVGSPGERANDIEVDDPAIANDQAIISYRSGRFTLMNYRSEIAVNQTPLLEGDVNVLQTGDRIILGESVVLFQERRVAELLRDYNIEVVEGLDSDMGKKFPLTRERMAVGRDRNADINLTDPGIAREHCLILVRGNKLYVQHRSDTNATSIGEWELKPGSERQISTEDQIRISSRTVLQLRRVGGIPET